MSGKIQKNEFIEDKDIIESLLKITTAIKDVAIASKQAAEEMKGINGFGGVSNAANGTTKNINKLSDAEKEQLELSKKLVADKKEEKAAWEAINKEQRARVAVDKEMAAADAEIIALQKKRTRGMADQWRANFKLNQEQRAGGAKEMAAADAEIIALQKKRTLGMADQWRANFKLNQAERELDGTYKKLQQDLQSNITAYKNLGVQNKQNTIEGKALNTTIRQQQAELNRINKTVPTTTKAFSGLLGSLKSLALSYIGITALVMGVQRLIKEVFNVTKKLDALDFSSKQVIKSEVELAQTQIWLMSTATKYGAEIINLTERYIKFRAAAIQADMSAIETQKIFGTLTKAAGVLGLKTDETAGIFLALEQMLSKGKVTTEELRRQLGERLPGAFGLMADALGVTLPQLDKMLRNGEIMSSVALPKLADEIEKTFGADVTGNIETLQAESARLKTAWIDMSDAMQASGFFKWFISGATRSLELWGGLIRGIRTDIVNDFSDNLNYMVGAANSGAKAMADSGYFKAIDDGATVAEASFISATKKVEDLSERIISLQKRVAEEEQAGFGAFEIAVERKLMETEKYNGDITKQLKILGELPEAEEKAAKSILLKKIAIKLLNEELKNNEDTLNRLNAPSILSKEDIDNKLKEYTDFYKLTTEKAKEEFLQKTSLMEDDNKTSDAWLKSNIDLYSKYIDTRRAEAKKAAEEYKAIKEKEGTGVTDIENKTIKNQIEIARKARDKSYALLEETIDARINLELALQEKTTKGATKKDDTLAILKDEMAQRIALYKQGQQAWLETEWDKIKDTEDANDQLKTIDEALAYSALEYQIKLQDEFLLSTKLSAKERAEEEKKLAELEAELAKQKTDAKISADNRYFENYSKREKERIDSEMSAIDVSVSEAMIGNALKTAAEIDAVAKSIGNAEYKKNKIEKINNDLIRSNMQSELDGLKAKELIYGLEIKDREKLAEEIKKIILALANFDINESDKAAALKIEGEDLVKQKMIEFTNEIFNTSQAFLDAQLKRAEFQRDREIALAGDSTEARIAAENRYDKKERELRRKQAILDMNQALFNIQMSAAQGIVAAWKYPPPIAIPLTVLIAAISTAQTAAVLAEPLPKYADGTDDAPMTFIAGEEGAELITTKSGKSFLTPNKATLFSDPELIGASITPNDITQKILADAAMNNFINDSVDLSVTNSYLRDIRDFDRRKETVTFSNGYKIINRKGLRGRYATRI